LFPKIKTATLSRRILWMGLIWALLALGIGYAQEPDPNATENPASGDEPQTEDATQDMPPESIPIPIRGLEDTQSLGEQTFIDDVFQSTRNRWGFALSAYHAYSSDISVRIDEPRQSSGITAFMPRTFFNFGKRKSKLHLDLGAGYRMYNKRRELDSWDYFGDAQYSLKISKRTSFQIVDQFTSSYNDSWSFVSLYSPLQYNPLSSNEVLFNRQRINRNSLKAALSHQATRRARFGVFGGYRTYEYPRNTLRNSNALEMGGDFYYQLAKWLYLSSNFSTYVNLAGQNQPDARIYRLQVGGLEFHLTDSWRIWAGGGVDISDYEGRKQTREAINAGIGYISKNTSFSLTYQRGFTSAIGISRLLQSDVASASLGQRLNRWLNANLQSYYYRSTEANSGGRLETLSGGGGLEFSLRRDLVMTMNASYQNQKTRSFSVEGLGLNRFSVYLGLQYMWPARRRSEN
jgi:hypothetical protein